jgi:hypothetical protein
MCEEWLGCVASGAGGGGHTYAWGQLLHGACCARARQEQNVRRAHWHDEGEEPTQQAKWRLNAPEAFAPGS